MLAPLLLFAPLLGAQCNPGNATGANSVSIICRAPTAQTQGLLRVLNRILAAQLDPDAVLARLDGMTGTAVRPISEPRVLSVSEIDRITRALAPFKGQKASIGYAVADAEAAQLADQLNEILRSAGWVQGAPLIAGGGSAQGDASGIDLTVAERSRATDALWNSLLAAGLDVIAHINPAAARDGSISIFVYSRR